jgi:hypothetical protein
MYVTENIRKSNITDKIIGLFTVKNELINIFPDDDNV